MANLMAEEEKEEEEGAYLLSNRTLKRFAAAATLQAARISRVLFCTLVESHFHGGSFDWPGRGRRVLNMAELFLARLQQIFTCLSTFSPRGRLA